MGAITYHVYCRILGSAIALLLHSANSLAMFLAMRGDILKDPDIEELHATQYKYFTIWNVAFQIAYSIMNLACDIPVVLKLKEDSSSKLYYLRYVRKYREALFGAVIFPTAMAIFAVFWPLYHYNRELIFPSFIDKALSHASNQIMHTAICPIVLWELLFLPRSKPTAHSWYIAHQAVIYITYYCVLFVNYAQRGTWPYPLFKYLYGTIHFPVFIVGLFTVYVCMYFLQWPLTSVIYNTGSQCKKTEKYHKNL